MWVKPIRPVSIRAGTSVTVGPLEAQKLIADGKALEVALPGSGEPLWDERKRPVAGGFTVPDDCKEEQLRQVALTTGLDADFSRPSCPLVPLCPLPPLAPLQNQWLSFEI